MRGWSIMQMRYFRLLYAFACTAWFAYVLISILNAAANRNPNPSAVVYCLLLLVVFPSALGYWLLFKALPWAGRILRRG
jgi:hypothetical protein